MLCFGAAQIVPTASASATELRSLAPDDLLQVQDVSDPRTSPDGQWVAYVLGTSDREADEARSAIWMTSWDGQQDIELTSAAEGTVKPRWNPSGRYLAYLAVPSGSDKAQIMLLDRRGGNAQRLTNVAGDISDYAWSPDGKHLALVMLQSEGGGPEKSPKPIVIDAFHFKQDEDGYLSSGLARHLYLFDVEAKRIESLTSDPGYNEDLPAWSPDGRQIAFTRTRERGADQDGKADIVVIDSRVGATGRTLTRCYAPNAQKIAWSPDGKLVTYLQGGEPKFNAYMQDHLFVVPAVGGAPRRLAASLDRAITSYAFAPDSKTVTVTVEDDGTAYATQIEVTAGTIAHPVRLAPLVVSDISAASGHVAVLKSDDASLAEVYALESGQLRKLTRHNEPLLSQLRLGSVEDISFKSKDGAEIHGLMVKPPDFVAGRRYPTLLWIHGGPNGGDEHSLVLDGYQFEPQMFAARGFVVLRVNYRGGSGRGEDFAKEIFRDWGHKEVEDLLAGVDYLVGQGIADKDRLAVGGWSYGGILTDYSIASDSRFKAAISGAGSANQLSTYGTDEYILQYNAELGPPWANEALWIKLSYPFFHADRIRTPTLFLGGDKDFNVPITGGEQMYQALRTLGIPAQLVIYPGEHHVFTRPSFVKDLAERIPQWVARFIPAGN
jgi:dipeptidyl aminopeptidase/acylaminoacyl peptidase